MPTERRMTDGSLMGNMRNRIIVGVKYCFRYNARQRARQNGDDDVVDLQAMPRPHRRRREKKLMTMDEVNERFPVLKYKAWRAQREAAGLPTEGGIESSSRAASRVGSVRDVDMPEIKPTPTSATDTDLPSLPPASASKELAPTNSPPASTIPAFPHPLPAPRLSTDDSYHPEKSHSPNDTPDDPDSDHEVDPDLLMNSGDTCAICLDTIEDNEDVRGLSCGHAFHSACIDPWLTCRRACCPLCKKDYYIPKPRTEGEVAAQEERRQRRAQAAQQQRIEREREQQEQERQRASGWLTPRFIRGGFLRQGSAEARQPEQPVEAGQQEERRGGGMLRIPRPAFLRGGRRREGDVEVGQGVETAAVRA